MKSSIKIDFIDRGTGFGIEPVIRIELIKSEDPRDTLLAVLFENTSSQDYLQKSIARCKQVGTGEFPSLERTIYLFKPEINTNSLMEIVIGSFNTWVGQEKYVTISDGWLNRGDKHISREDLFKEFVSVNTGHTEAPMPNS